jgi:hypothetical protein
LGNRWTGTLGLAEWKKRNLMEPALPNILSRPFIFVAIVNLVAASLAPRN